MPKEQAMDDGPTMKELRQRLLPASKKLTVTMPQQQQRYRPSSLFERARNTSTTIGPVDVDEFIPPKQQRFTARSHSAPRRLVRSSSGNNSNTYTTRTAQEQARDVSHRWTKASGANGRMTASGGGSMRPTRSLSGSRPTQRRSSGPDRGRAMSPPTPSSPTGVKPRIRTFSPPPPSTRAALVDPLSPTTRASKYESSSRGTTPRTNRNSIVSINLTSPSHSRQQQEAVRSPKSRKSLQHPREYAAQYYASKVRQDAQQSNATSRNNDDPEDSLAELLEQSTVSTSKGLESSTLDYNSFSLHTTNDDDATDDDTSSPDSRFIYTRRRTNSSRHKQPVVEELPRHLQSPEQVSRQVHSRRIQTRKQQQQHASPTSVLAEVQRRIFRPRPDEEYHDDENGDELENLTMMRGVCPMDALDASSIDTPSQQQQQHQQYPADETSTTDGTMTPDPNEPAESKYSRAIRYLATQDATILSLQTELEQARQEVLDLRESKEHQTTAIHSLQTQLAATRQELQSAQTEMARRSQAHETASAQSFREQIAAEDARQKEMQKTREAQRETELLKQQVMELEAEVNRWRPHSSSGTRNVPPIIPVLPVKPMDTSFGSASTASSTTSSKQLAAETKTTAVAPTKAPADASAKTPPPPLAAPLAAPAITTTPASSPSVELERASSCVTEVIANTSSRIQSSSTNAAGTTTDDNSSENDEIAELRAALLSACSQTTGIANALPRTQKPSALQRTEPKLDSQRPRAIVEEDSETSLRNQLRIVRGEQTRSPTRPTIGTTGEATGEVAALLSDVSSDLDDDDDDDAALNASPRATHTSMTLPDTAMDPADRETSSLGGARWHAVGDEEVQSLLKELQQMKQTVSSAQGGGGAPERGSTRTSKDRFSFSSVGISNRSNSSSRRANPDATDEAVVDSLRRRLGR